MIFTVTNEYFTEQCSPVGLCCGDTDSCTVGTKSVIV